MLLYRLYSCGMKTSREKGVEEARSDRLEPIDGAVVCEEPLLMAERMGVFRPKIADGGLP